MIFIRLIIFSVFFSTFRLFDLKYNDFQMICTHYKIFVIAAIFCFLEIENLTIN